MSYLVKTVQPASEPVTLAQAQLYLRLDTDGDPATHPDDSLIESMISAARESAENYTNTTIAQATYQLQNIASDDYVSLQTYPVTSITSVTYEDSDGVTQTVSSDDYYVDNFKRPSRLVFTQNTPTSQLTVTFVAGCTDGQTPNSFPCPSGIRAAILLMLGNLYENRESVSNIESYERPQSATFLLMPHRVNMGV